MLFSHPSSKTLTLALLPLLAACGNKPPSAPPSVPPDEVVWKVQTPVHAVALAVGDRYQIPVVALNVYNDSISTPATQFTFTSGDSTTVHVDDAGRISARAITPMMAPTRVFVTLTSRGATRADTLYVSVTDTALPTASLSIQPAPSDSARVSIMLPAMLAPRLLNADGAVLSGPYIHIRAERPQSVFLNAAFGMIMAYAPGKQWIHAEINAYGKAFRDSVQFEFLYSAQLGVDIISPEPGVITIPVELLGQTTYIQRCGLMVWNNRASEPVDIVFDMPGNTGTCTPGDETGNAMNVAPGASVIRKFPKAGITQWTLRRSAAPTAVLATSNIEAK